MIQNSSEPSHHVAPKYTLYGMQVSGKAPKLATSDNKSILKCYISEEE